MVNKPDFPSPGQSPGAYTLSYGYSTEVSKFILIKVDSSGVVQVNGTIASGTLTANLGTTDTTNLATIATNSATAATSAKQDTGNTTLSEIALDTDNLAILAGRLDSLIQLQLETRNASLLMLNIMARQSITPDDLRWK